MKIYSHLQFPRAPFLYMSSQTQVIFNFFQFRAQTPINWIYISYEFDGNMSKALLSLTKLMSLQWLL
jgi:hypothetical protein